MTMQLEQTGSRRNVVWRRFRLTWLAIGALVLVVGTWLVLTPPGLLGKADAVGYAVCHRIAERSFTIGGRQMPLCARCLGAFLGVLIGLFGPTLLGRRRATLFPPIGVLAILALFTMIWGFDGLNSYLQLVLGRPFLYTTLNWMRLTTGMFHGITLGSLVLPIFNATIWADPAECRTIGGLRELAPMLLVGGLLIGLVLSGEALILYPLALLSAAGVVAALATINSTMMAMMLNRENQAHTFTEALPVLLLGLTVAFIEIGSINVLRYLAFGTWEGFQFPH